MRRFRVQLDERSVALLEEQGLDGELLAPGGRIWATLNNCRVLK
jgi:hypothetical protein